MKFVYKYPIPIEDDFELELPKGAEILSVQSQFNKAQMWACVDINAPKITRTFRIVGTGYPIEDEVVHIGTFQLEGGGFIGHLFEVR